MQVYVKAQSKKDLNERLAADHVVMATEYKPDGLAIYENLRAFPSGTIVRIYSKRAGSTPIAKSYGTWDAIKRRVK